MPRTDLYAGSFDPVTNGHLDVVPGRANFLLCHLPEGGVTASKLLEGCRARNLFLRDATSMGVRAAAVRVAVKDAATNRQMMQIVADVLQGIGGESPDVDSRAVSVFS